MKIFMCTPQRSTYCDDYACIVSANSKEEARILIEKKNIFDKGQGKITIKEIKLNKNKAKILLTANVGA